MSTLRNKYIILLVVLNALLTLVLCLWGQCIFTDITPFLWTVIAMAFLFLYEILAIMLMDKKEKSMAQRKSVNLFLGLKVGKILLSLIFVGVYAIAIKVEVKRFVMVFAALYLVYLLFDTVYLAKREKKK